MGELAYYGWAAGKDRIEGPSQAIAYAAARCWGNCAVDQLSLEENADAWIFTSVFVDCETGFTLTRKFRQSKKWTVHGKLDPERKDDVRFQIGQTKGDRNVILKALPKWLIDKGVEEAKAGVRAKLESYINKHGMPAAIDYALKELAKSGISTDRVCSKYSVAKPSALSLENLVIIAGDIKAIQQGQEYPESLYPTNAAADIADQIKSRAGKAKPPSAKSPEEVEQQQPDGSAAEEEMQANIWIDNIREMERVEDLNEERRNISDDFSPANKIRIVAAIDARIAELQPKRGGRGKQPQNGLFDTAPNAQEG